MSIHDDYVAKAGYELRSPDASRLLVLLHGLGGDRSQPLGLLRGAALPDFAVLAPDARAHGATGVVGDAADFRFDSMAEDILALIDATGQAHKPTYIAGISMGAALALRLILTGRLDVQGAAFIRPAFSGVPVPKNLAVMPLIAAALSAYGQDEGLARFTARPEYQAVAAVSASGAISLREQFAKPEALRRSIRLREVPQNTAYADPRDLGMLRIPCLVVAAAGDPVHPVDLAKVWADGIRGAAFVEVPSRDADSEAYEGQMQDAFLNHIGSVFY